jgi:hypothetical protein
MYTRQLPSVAGCVHVKLLAKVEMRGFAQKKCASRDLERDGTSFAKFRAA